MRRWLLIFVLALLPLQFSWAAVARYCGHEGGHEGGHERSSSAPSGAKHFGHHAHEHDSASSLAKPSAAEVDDDCASCHLGCAQPIPVDPFHAVPSLSPPRVARLVAMPPSHFPPGLERPDRSLA